MLDTSSRDITMSDSSKDKDNFLDLSELSNFQFGPAWAKNDRGGNREYKRDFKSGKGGRPFKGDNRRPRRDDDRPRRDDDRRPRRDDDKRRRPQRQRLDRSALVPTEKVRVEIRPVDSGLSTLALEIQKHKRCYSLYDLAKVVMGSRDRYEIWFIKEEGGPDFYYCKKSPSIWLTQEEALSSIWKSPVIEEYYEEVKEGESISWKPKREGAQEIVLSDEAAVEADVLAHSFEEIFDVTHKCFIQGDVASKKLSLGLFAHLLKIVESARFHPSQIIPNICHGLARHRLPLFKWNGGHHTGPSRPHAVPADMVLADRLQTILAWVTENGGKGVDAMLHDLAAPLPEGETEPSEEILKIHGEWVSDLLWLLQEGYVLVMSDGKVHLAKQAVAPEPPKDKSKKAKKKKSDAPKAKEVTSEALATEAAQVEVKAEESVPAEVAEPVVEEAPVPEAEEAPVVVEEPTPVETAEEAPVVEAETPAPVEEVDPTEETEKPTEA